MVMHKPEENGYMRRVRQTAVAIALVFLSVAPAPSQALPLGFDMEILLLLAGPVSEAVQETVLLVRRGDNFVSRESLNIGCVAGASAGFLVGMAPALGFVQTGVGAPVGVAYVVGTMLLSCGMAMASSGAGMGTAWALREWREWRATAPPIADTHLDK
jgi:hypothetical protein